MKLDLNTQQVRLVVGSIMKLDLNTQQVRLVVGSIMKLDLNTQQVRLVVGSIMKLDRYSFGGKFHFVNFCGVLHHLPGD